MWNIYNVYTHAERKRISHYVNTLFIDLVSMNRLCMKKSCILLQINDFGVQWQNNSIFEMTLCKRLLNPYFLLAELFIFLIFPRGSRQSQASGLFPQEHSHHASNSRTQKHGWERWKRCLRLTRQRAGLICAGVRDAAGSSGGFRLLL